MPIELSIVTPHGVAFQDSVESVVLPGSEGRFGVLERHERFLAPLRPGEVEIRSGRGTLFASVSRGYALVSEREVAVLAESAELADEIDVDRAERARARAREGLARLGRDADPEQRAQYQEALERAEARLAVGRQR
jgi:F-type H+-transporting ATPase subunit epsilon